ncbi:IS3 family transposase [Polaribacter litorisediminis]|nr:IS3 family transposase [Polaribacter litorisediminis]
MYEVIEDYINWFSNKRVHSSIGYLSSIKMEITLIGFIKKVAL